MIQYANGRQETQPERLLRILPLLACPFCRGPLAMEESRLRCQSCDAHHPIRGGVPVLLPAGVLDGGAVGLSATDRVSRHPYSVRAEEIIARHPSGSVLDLGAGGKLERRENVVQIDIFRYPAVDVVGSADCLPFQDNAFDAVISQAVFEHLQYPEWAVSEVRRVLKPGGIAKIDTAFLQPEHGYPHHFYNATETGLLHWFRDFEIQWSGVEPFQHPKWALHWFLGVYLDFIGKKEADVLRKLPVGDLLDTLQRHSTQQTTPEDLHITAALDALPEHFLRVLAAGVSVHAINPPKHEVSLGAIASQSSGSLDREREMAQLRVEKNRLLERTVALQESLKALGDEADYLAQFYPSSSNLAQFAAAWVDPMHLRQMGSSVLAGDSNDSLPFATIILCPIAVKPLLATFFSLVNQGFSGWELVLMLGADVGDGVRRAASALCRLDRRVVPIADRNQLVELDIAEWAPLRGDYWMHLPEGATFASDALKEVVTVAANLPGVCHISFDFDRATPGTAEPMRCHTLGPSDRNSSGDYGVNVLGFARVKRPMLGAANAPIGRQEAHIPKALVHLSAAILNDGQSDKASVHYLLEQYREVSDELQQMNGESPAAARELRQLTSDSANYLAQFFFDQKAVKRLTLSQAGPIRWVRQAMGRWVRNNVSLATLTQLFSWRAVQSTQPVDIAESPFVSITLTPTNAISLIHTFFSLVHQSFSGWELILIETDDVSPAVRRAMRDFSALDRRVVIVGAKSAHDTGGLKIRGTYRLELIDGITLAFNAIEQVVTLVKAAPSPHYVVCDFDCTTRTEWLPMRCYNFGAQGMRDSFADQAQFGGTFVIVNPSDSGAGPSPSSASAAHIPLCLFHQTRQEAEH